MNILFLSPYFSPESVASSHIIQNLREALVNENFKLKLFAPTPTRGVSREIREKYKKVKYEEQLNGKFKIYRFPLIPERKNSLQRAFRYFLCHIIHFYIGIQSQDIDILFIASTPPTQGAMGALVKKVKKIPLVYNLQDIFPDSLVSTGLTRKGSLFWTIGRAIENFTYRNADKIIVISEGFKKNIMLKGVPESKIEVIYNWVDENEVVAVPRALNILFDRYNLDRNKFYITYNGNIGLTQNMDLLLDIAGMFKENKTIHFVIMGEGAYKTEVEKRMKAENIDNVTILPFQPYEEISHVFSLGDSGLVISKENVGQNSIPSKTWSIMSASRPVIASFDENSELQEIIEKNKAGIFVKASDKEALYKAIMLLFNNPEMREEMGKNGRTFILKNLTREVGTSKYVDVIKSVSQASMCKGN